MFMAKTENGELIFEGDVRLKEYLKTVEGKPLSVKITQYRKGRSDNQNRYYWACVNVMAKEWGYTSEELHDTLRAMFLVDRSGPVPVVRSSAGLDTKEFTEYMDHVQRFAAEHNIIIPDPNHFDEAYPS